MDFPSIMDMIFGGVKNIEKSWSFAWKIEWKKRTFVLFY